MHTNHFTFLIFIFLILASCKHNTDPNDSSEESQFNFVLYDDLSASDISIISDSLKENYPRIISDLQVPNMPTVTVNLWADYEKFMNTMESDISIRYAGAKGYIRSATEFVLWYNERSPIQAVHEFAHVVSMQLNSRIPNNPRWLWEAVAIYEARQFIHPKNVTYLISGDFPSLSELNSDFNSGNYNIYTVGFVLTEYIVQTWGMDAVIGLIKNNGNITNLLGISTAEFESGWYFFVEEKYLK